MLTPPRGVLFDVDGTLIDSNDAHTHAWIDAMALEGHQIAFDTVRPLIGMGADKVLPQILDIAKETDEGRRISQHRKDIFKQHYLPHLKAFPGALDLLTRMQGLTLIIATTAEPDELQGLLPLIGPNASSLFANAATAREATDSKPDGDVIQAAVERSGYPPEELVMIGDTAYDIKAAAKVGIPTIAFRSGGWSNEDLAAATARYDGPADLLARYETSVLVQGIAHGVKETGQSEDPLKKEQFIRQAQMSRQTLIKKIGLPLVEGSLAGLIATVPMTLFMLAVQRLLPQWQQYALPPENFTAKIASRVGLKKHMNKPQLLTASFASHLGFGAAMGTIYGPLAKLLPFPPIVKGIVFGSGVWLAVYRGWLPAIGMSEAATKQPAQRNMLMIGAHLVWGATMGAGTSLLARVFHHFMQSNSQEKNS